MAYAPDMHAHSKRLAVSDLETLYREYYPRVYNHIYYRLLSRDQTEDLVSEVFVKAVRGFSRFDSSKASFSTWIFHITHNALIDYYRANKTTSSLDDLEGYEPSEEDEYGGLDERAAEVRQLLAFLDAEDRELIFLKYYEEKSNSEIAALLDMNPSTVSTRLSRAMAKMRSHIGEVYPDGGR